MPLKDLFVQGIHLGGFSGKKRSPRFIHALVDNSTEETMCGVNVSGWSRKMFSRKKLLEILMPDLVCRNCAHKVGLI